MNTTEWCIHGCIRGSDMDCCCHEGSKLLLLFETHSLRIIQNLVVIRDCLCSLWKRSYQPLQYYETVNHGWVQTNTKYLGPHQPRHINDIMTMTTAHRRCTQQQVLISFNCRLAQSALNAIQRLEAFERSMCILRQLVYRHQWLYITTVSKYQPQRQLRCIHAVQTYTNSRCCHLANITIPQHCLNNWYLSAISPPSFRLTHGMVNAAFNNMQNFALWSVRCEAKKLKKYHWS